MRCLFQAYTLALHTLGLVFHTFQILISHNSAFPCQIATLYLALKHIYKETILFAP